MRFSISISSVVFLTLYYGSILEAAPRSPKPFWLLGYDCDDVFIAGSKLQEVISQVKYARDFENNDPKVQSSLKNYYNGPPFTKPYLLWPVSPATAGYHGEKGMKSSSTALYIHRTIENPILITLSASTPYRAVISSDNQIFSVVNMSNDGVKECILRYTGSEHYTEDLLCSKNLILNKDLRAAAKAACPLTRGIATRKFPARYSGHLFKEQNKQLYVYPVIPNSSYNAKTAAGPYRLVMDSQCKTVGAIMYHSQKKLYRKCRRYLKLS